MTRNNFAAIGLHQVNRAKAGNLESNCYSDRGEEWVPSMSRLCLGGASVRPAVHKRLAHQTNSKMHWLRNAPNAQTALTRQNDSPKITRFHETTALTYNRDLCPRFKQREPTVKRTLRNFTFPTMVSESEIPPSRHLRAMVSRSCLAERRCIWAMSPYFAQHSP